MLSWVEHETSFITTGPGLSIGGDVKMLSVSIFLNLMLDY